MRVVPAADDGVVRGSRDWIFCTAQAVSRCQNNGVRGVTTNMDTPRSCVLLVATDPRELNGYERALHGAGCAVASATSFAVARKLIDQGRHDVLITALRLGDFNGLHLAIISRAKYPTTPTVVIGDPDSGVEADTAAIGAQGLVRPVSPEELTGFVQRLLAGVRAN
jgi:DNA-binding response OmpR family regulator